MKDLRAIFFVLIGLLSLETHSAGYSNWAVPTHVELVSGGLLVYGEFGNPHGCIEANKFFVSDADTRFQTIVSMSLAALMAKREMQFYGANCTDKVSFHWAGLAINENLHDHPVYIK